MSFLTWTQNPFLFSLHFSSLSHKIPRETYKAVKMAIDEGYRHLDGAYLYHNEHEVGEAIREKIAEGKVKREEIFYCGKVSHFLLCRYGEWGIGLGDAAQ